jgi:hypothetical protein
MTAERDPLWRRIGRGVRRRLYRYWAAEVLNTVQPLLGAKSHDLSEQLAANREELNGRLAKLEAVAREEHKFPCETDQRGSETLARGLALAREVLRKNVAQEWPGLKEAKIIKTGDHTSVYSLSGPTSKRSAPRGRK